MSAVRSVALGLWVGNGSPTRPKRGGHLTPARAHAVPRHARYARARSTRCSTRSARRSTRRPTGRRRRFTPACSTCTSSGPSPDRGNARRAGLRIELDTEREVVLEEIAMYEDDPQERCSTSSARLYGGHPLGRAMLGTRRGRRGDDARADCAPSTSSATARGGRRRGGRLARPRRDRRARRKASRRLKDAAGAGAAARCERAAARAACASSRRRPNSSTSASVAPGLAARRRAPLRAARAGRRARRDHLIAAVPADP